MPFSWDPGGPESGGIPDKQSFTDDSATQSGYPVPRYGGALLMWGSLNAMEEEPKAFFQEPSARICGLDFADDMDSGDGVHWPEPAGGADMLDIVCKFGHGADVCGTFATAPGILSTSVLRSCVVWRRYVGPGVFSYKRDGYGSRV